MKTNKELFDEWKEKQILSIVGLDKHLATDKLSKIMTPEGVWLSACELKDAEIKEHLESIAVSFDWIASNSKGEVKEYAINNAKLIRLGVYGYLKQLEQG